MSRRSSCSISIFLIGIIVTLILMLIGITTASAKENNPDSRYTLWTCKAMTPEEAVERFPQTNHSDWYNPVDTMAIYNSTEGNFLEIMVMPNEVVKDHDDDMTIVFYDSTFGSGRMSISATKLNIVCLDSYVDMPFVDDAPMACPMDPVNAVLQFAGQPDGWSSTVDPRLKLTVLSYLAPSAIDRITIIVPKEVLAVVNGHLFGPGEVIPDVTSVTLRMYCSQNLTVGN